MFCSQVKNYDISTSQLAFIDLRRQILQWVPCHFGSSNGGVYIFVFKCTVRFQARTWKCIHRFLEICVMIVQDSKNCNTHHSFSFSCREVRLLLIPSCCFLFAFGCVEMIKIDFHKKGWTRSENISFKKDSSREWKVSKRVRSRKLLKHSETGYVSVFPHIFQLESKKVPKIFFAFGRNFDWFLVLEPEVNYPAYHEHDCTFAYIDM